MGKKITFDNVLADDCTKDLVISPGCKTQVEGKFTVLRVDRSTLPDGWYAYDIMHSDQGGFLLLKEHVLVNHAGTFLTTQKIDLDQNGVRYLNGRGGYAFVRKEAS